MTVDTAVAPAVVASDRDDVTRRERQRQSDFRERVLALPAGTSPHGKVLGNYLTSDKWQHNFLSLEAAAYARFRAVEVPREGGALEPTRLFTNMLSSMPLCFSVFGHLRAHRSAAVTLLGDLLGLELVSLEDVVVPGRRLDGIECEWAPEPAQHLGDRTAFDAVVAARRADGGLQLIAVETKYVDGFSRDRHPERTDATYDRAARSAGMADGAWAALRGDATRQLARNTLLTESVRRGGSLGTPRFDVALTVVLARDDDAAARAAVDAVRAARGGMATDVRFVGHGELADAAARVDELRGWSAAFRRRYLA
jgi:hypothetical protein